MSRTPVKTLVDAEARIDEIELALRAANREIAALADETVSNSSAKMRNEIRLKRTGGAQVIQERLEEIEAELRRINKQAEAAEGKKHRLEQELSSLEASLPQLEKRR